MRDRRICVHLNQPQFEVFIHHEIHAEDLEVEAAVGVLLCPFLWVLAWDATIYEFRPAGIQHVNIYAVHLCSELLPNRTSFAWFAVLLVDIFLEYALGQLITFLVTSIAGWLSLNGIISKVHQPARWSNIESLARCSYIALLVAIDPQLSVEQSDQHIAPYVEFALVIQQRSDVSLQNDAFTFAFLSESFLQFSYGVAALASHCNASPAVGVFPGFDDPVAVLIGGELVQNRVFQRAEFIRFGNYL